MTKIYKPPSFDNQIVVPKNIFDSKVSLSALGFYCWLFTRKSNLPITFQDIKKSFDVTDHTIRKQINELENAKYLSKIPVRNSGKFGGYNYYISDVTMLKKPHTVKHTRSAAITNTNIYKNTSIYNNNTNTIIYNKNNNNTIKIKNEKLFSEIKENINHFMALFPKKYCQNNTDQLKWIECIYKLIELDGYTLRKLYSIIKTIRNDEFWQTNFLTLLKLRKKNKDGILYIDFFNEIYKSKKPKSYYKVKNLESYFIYDSNNKKLLGAVANNIKLTEFNLKNVLNETEIQEIKNYVETN